MVIVDLPGGASALALKAFHRSHFVLIPAQPSMPDVKAAMKTVAQIDDAQELARAPIARAMVWTRIMPGFESVPVRQVRAAEESADITQRSTGRNLPVPLAQEDNMRHGLICAAVGRSP